jgi:hypothetical protein
MRSGRSKSCDRNWNSEFQSKFWAYKRTAGESLDVDSPLFCNQAGSQETEPPGKPEQVRFVRLRFS